MTLVDTHCHLYTEDFNADLEAVIVRARENGIKKFYFPAIDSESTAAMLAVEKNHPGECFAMMGLHPCSVKENYKEELKMVEQWLHTRKFVAIGEIGLDFYWDKTFITEQFEAFELQMQWALDRNMPISIHTRNAMQETIDRVKPFAAKGLRGIFHCFGGSYETAIQIINMNFYLGIGGVLTYKNAGLPLTLEKIGLEHMVLETDAPYLTPVPFRGKRNESAYIKLVAEKLAEVKKTSLEKVAVITTANAAKIFK